MISRLQLLLFSLSLSFAGLFAYADDNTADTDTNVVSVFIAEAYIELHTGPGRGYPVFYIAERGEYVEILKQRTDWYKVRTLPRNPNDSKIKQGWVYIDQIAKVLDHNKQPISLNYPEFSDFTQRSWEGGFMAGSFGGVDEVSVYAGYHFTRNLAIELALSESFGDISNGQAATINIVHQPFPNWRVSPFFTLGGGMRKTEPKSNLVSTKDRTDDTLNVGVGVTTYITRRLLLRLQYKNHTVLTSRDDDEEVEEWKIGLSTFF